jgi:hypothetical protein
MRGIWKPLVVVLIGLAIGAYGWGAHSDTVTCGDSTLYSGEECLHMNINSGSVTNSYEKGLAVKRRFGWIVVGVGAVILLGSGYRRPIVEIGLRRVSPQWLGK